MPVRLSESPVNTDEITVTANQRLEMPLPSVLYLKADGAVTIKLPFDFADDLRTMPQKIGIAFTGTSTTNYATSPVLRQHAGDGVTPLRRGRNLSGSCTLVNISGNIITIDKANLINRAAHVAIPDKSGAEITLIDDWTGSVGGVTTNKQPGGWQIELLGVLQG